MKQYRCKVCGEIITSDSIPEMCPRCKVKGDDRFEEVRDDKLTWAAEHVVGIAKDVPEEIKD
ncbi:MAG: NADH peroxidase, partial [Clostridia bacterium]|nr:NADH peroxidase [Clostridia bacterium]